MGALGWEAWYTCSVVVGMVVALAREVARPDLVLLASLALLLVAGVISPDEAFDGFANPAVLTIASLFVVAAGIQRTDALAFLDRVLFTGNGDSIRTVLLRLMGMTSGLSAFVNNTPLVAMLMPRVQAWAEQKEIAPSKMMMPLSYAAVLGGIVTLIGTSTNLVVAGILEQSTGRELRMFDFTAVGLPAAVLAVTYFALVGHRLLPVRSRPTPGFDGAAEAYHFELRIPVGSPLAGRTVEEAELRALRQAFLTRIRRGNRVVGPVGPQEILQERDVLVFTGRTTVLDRLLDRPGLERVSASLHHDEHFRLPLFEAVVSPSSGLVGRTLKEADFRNRFQGVVLAIQRRDEAIQDELGSTRLRSGDLLVIEAREDFYEHWKSNREEFYLVAPLRGTISVTRREKAPIALALFLAMVVVSATGVLPLVTAAFLAALGMMLTRCLHLNEARLEIDIPILIMIAAALGIGITIEQTGVAGAVAAVVINSTASFGPVATLAAVYLVTNLLTELLTNSAAAALMTPIAIAAALGLHTDPVPYALAVAIAASAGFVTPFGYQTNLMVMSAGGYRVGDYFRAGLPLNLIVMVVTILCVWLVWM